MLGFEHWTPSDDREHLLVSLLIPVAVLGAAAWTNYHVGFNGADLRLSASILLLVVFVLALFVQAYGWAQFTRARFPLLLLFLAVPLPAGLILALVTALQHGSADAAYGLFRLFRVPVVRSGLVFSFSNLEIEVAQECSGIRSSTILLVTTLVLAYLFLRSGWTRAVAVIATVPVAVAKNGVRIFTLSVLGEYVSTSWLEGSLHHQGGFVFFALGMGLLILLIGLLRKAEQKKETCSPGPLTAGSRNR